MTQAIYKDEWLNKAFRLAFFIHGERETAKRIAVSAMNKLEIASNAQFKRYYYTPNATRSRVSFNDLQLLQRLVLVESEIFEREKEQAKATDEKSLLKYFIKHLVRIALKRNSFYVTLGISRILHNYGTNDAMEIYNVIVQNPERVHDDYYYRSRKGVLMKELKARFEEMLETVKVNRGEERFLSQNENENLSETARECLKFFTPWNSTCAIPDKFNPFDDIIKPFYFDKKDPDEEHRIEVNRIHAALHPECFKSLTEALKLPPSEEKMEIPKFMINNQTANFDDNDWQNPSDLQADELEQIKNILAAQAENRKAMSANLLRVAADGADIAHLNLDETDAIEFDLDGNAELIEVYGDGETLLATHLLSFDGLAKGNQTQMILLEGGQKITFDLKPTIDQYGEISSLNCTINYAETAWQKRFAMFWQRTKIAFAAQNRILKPALTFGLLLLALTFGWLILRNSGNDKNQIVENLDTPNKNAEIVLPQNSKVQEKEEIVEKKDRPKTEEETTKPIKEKESPKILANVKKPETKEKIEPKKRQIEAPQNEFQATNVLPKRKSETDENGILRLPIRGNNQSFGNERNETRGNSKIVKGKSLTEIRRIYIEITGDQILGKQIAEQISAEISANGRFSVTNDKELADAALKIYVRHESDVDEPNEKMITAIVRLVNAEGFIVFPNQKRVSAWKYIGEIGKLPKRIAGDLVK